MIRILSSLQQTPDRIVHRLNISRKIANILPACRGVQLMALRLPQCRADERRPSDLERHRRYPPSSDAMSSVNERTAAPRTPLFLAK